MNKSQIELQMHGAVPSAPVAENRLLAVVAGKRIPVQRIIAFWSEKRLVFPFIKIINPYKTTSKFPFVRKWLMSKSVRKKTNDFLVVQMDNGIKIKQRFKDGYYPSSIYCEQAMGKLSGNYR